MAVSLAIVIVHSIVLISSCLLYSTAFVNVFTFISISDSSANWTKSAPLYGARAPAKEAVRIMQTLRMLGFNAQLLGSGQYVLAKLEGLNQLELAKIKEAFIRNKHQRFLKEFFSHLPYGKTEVYKGEVENANLEKVARLIKISSFLLQTKVYLFWSRL